MRQLGRTRTVVIGAGLLALLVTLGITQAVLDREGCHESSESS